MQRSTRRTFLLSATAAALFSRQVRAATGNFEVTRTEAEWRAMLTDTQYLVMREEKTEKPYFSPLNDETRAGTYICRGCDLPLYASETKYDSGTGWPSFTAPLGNAVRTKPDNTLFTRRTEVHCRRCGSHLGHIFDDGPAPTGKRHCLNGSSLVFVAK
ncbi:peptide-methionine (R)-S-oxide reductase MsrB [Litoreibacter arenae]|uniref:peptide-methionine (R)-S-oxide reductase n=1 Tax=Litoreibacter arenae DSM 19593 TaxID=1123360 RepID=S9QKA1_9RHOB|nr:peptide-methionine (R)-S-oxide reductase MsrB [Litoreibacter arenae]EPX80202.1 Peptide methionine sulfoxide reductase MsrB [Litoreibacter arenae DSM 19593]